MTTFNYVSITAKDVSKETRDFLLNDHADYSAIGLCDSGLFYLKDTIKQMLDEDFFDEDERPSIAVIEDLTKILQKMEEDNANFLFFN